MSAPPPHETGAFAARLWLARAFLFWEIAWPACWPVLAIVATWLVLSLFDVLPSLPGSLHLAILIGLGAALLVALVRAGRAIALPDRAAARRRIERASGLRHRPLQTLADRPSGPLDAPSERLWQAHLARMAAAARPLRVGAPIAGLARHDPWGLRSVLAILLLVGAIDAGGDWHDRLARAVLPSFSFGPPAPAPSLDIWVTPPEYTGLPPLFLKPGSAATVRVPTGSKLLAQVHGGRGAPRLAVDGRQRDFAAVDSENFRIAAVLTQGRNLAVSQDGATLGSWPIAIVPDKPPTAAFLRPPTATPHAALRTDYQATDDYGVEALKLVIRRQGGRPGEILEVPLDLPGLHLKLAKGASYHDLSPHPWAGLPVEMRLVATDAIGQTGESAPVRMVLPERTFRNPVARAVIDQRKELVKDPTAREPVAEILGDLRAQTPLYHGDAVAFLDLRLAEERLRLDHDPKALAEVEQLMWDTALRIEDGSMSFAERDLRRLQRELQDALARNAPDAEIDRLMRDLRQAMDQYLKSLAERMGNNPEQARPTTGPSRFVTRQDLQRMLDQAREMMRSGDRERARQLLSQLQEMLENLQLARPAPQQGDDAAEQAMQGMRDLMQRQQQLLDRSFRDRQRQREQEQGQPGQPGQSGQLGQPGQGQGPADDFGDAAGRQEALRRSLGDIMRRLGEAAGEIPGPFNRAERAMGRAAQALRQGLPGQAIGPQTDALDALQQAARQFAQRLQQRLQGRRGDDQGGGADWQSERDPLGRPLSNGGFDQGDVRIPDNNTLEKARAILDELRRRAGDRARPELELDYINRLLQQF